MTAEDALPLELLVDRKQPRATQIYEAIRAAIMDMRLKPGTPISENRICRQTNVSRTPAREAIIRLGQDGLIDVFPQHGSFVAPISIRKVIEGHFIREALEIALLKRAAILWRPQHTAKMEAILVQQRLLADACDYAGFYREDENFHRYFAAVAQMDGVSTVIKESNANLARVRQLATPMAGHMEAALADHRSIFEALKDDKPDQAVALLGAHLDRVFQTINRLAELHREFFGDLEAMEAGILSPQ
jgi:DNA-binding GntR family transcriptional regulator